MMKQSVAALLTTKYEALEERRDNIIRLDLDSVASITLVHVLGWTIENAV